MGKIVMAKGRLFQSLLVLALMAAAAVAVPAQAQTFNVTVDDTFVVWCWLQARFRVVVNMARHCGANRQSVFFHTSMAGGTLDLRAQVFFFRW